MCAVPGQQAAACATVCRYGPPAAARAVQGTLPAHHCSSVAASQTMQRLAAPGGGLQGADSFYAPYLATLPAGHNCVLGWRDDEKAELRGTRLVAADLYCNQKVWF